MRILEVVVEAAREEGKGFNRFRKEKGEVPFKSSALTDPHIRDVILDLSKRTGVPISDINKDLTAKMQKYEEVGKYSPMLYDTLIKNAAENAAFSHIMDSAKLNKLNLSEITFDDIIFKRLVKLVQIENPAFFPLKPRGEIKPLYRIPTIIVPDPRPEYKKYDNVTTACATPRGDFVFNRPFMQQLMYYATSIGLKPKSAKYVSNGGVIPDNYAYIEFLIMHELLHYAYGDFSTSLRFKQYTHTAHNWAMDFRSNYMLVKSGYEQLPVGLFSDDLNFDRKKTNTYKKLIKVLDAELKKLPKELKAWVEKEAETDAHAEPPEPKEPWIPNIGDIVLSKKEGVFVKVTAINGDGTIEASPISPAEAEQLKRDGVKIG